MRLKTVGVALVVLLASGIVAARAVAESTLIVPRQGVGDVMFGMSAADVYRVLGDPERSIKYDRPQGRYTYVWDQRGIAIDYSDRGTFGRDDPGGVYRIYVWKAPWATSDGIAVGTSLLRVQALLGNPNQTTKVQPGGVGTIETHFFYRTLALWIYFNDSGIVTTIDAYRDP